MAKPKNSARSGSRRAGSEAAGARPKRTKPSSKRAPAVKAPKAARRNSFTPALGDKICDLMGEGKSLRFICSLEGMPTRQAVNKWLHKGESADAPKPFKDFVVQYIRAREKLADFYAESISDIADEGMRDADEVEDKLVGHFKAAASGDEDSPQVIEAHARAKAALDALRARQDARRMQTDARKWAAGKMAPKKYGSKIEDGVREAVGDSLAALIGSIDGQTRGL
jgi:hypothetical protein